MSEIYVAGWAIVLGFLLEGESSDEIPGFWTCLLFPLLSWFAVGMMLSGIFKKLFKESSS